MPGKTREGKLDAPIEPGAPMEHGPVGRRAAAKVMPFDYTRKAPAFTGTDDVDDIFRLELIDQNAIALLSCRHGHSPGEIPACNARPRRRTFSSDLRRV